MFIRIAVWGKIRTQFSRKDKEQLNAAICGQAICPRGLIIDPDRLTPGLLAKLGKAIKGAK